MGMGKASSTTGSAFGSFIRSKREQLNLSRGEIAELLGFSRSFLDVLETGRRGCDLDDLPRLAQVLQTDNRQLARVYLAERHPALYRALFGEEGIEDEDNLRPVQVDDSHWRLERLPRRERGIVEALIYSLDELTRGLQESREQRGKAGRLP